MPGEPVCRRERRAGESVVDSGYMEAGGRGCGQPARGGVLSPGPQGTVYHQSRPLERRESASWWWGFGFRYTIIVSVFLHTHHNWPVFSIILGSSKHCIFHILFIIYLFVYQLSLRQKHHTNCYIIYFILFSYYVSIQINKYKIYSKICRWTM